MDKLPTHYPYLVHILPIYYPHLAERLCFGELDASVGFSFMNHHSNPAAVLFAFLITQMVRLGEFCNRQLARLADAHQRRRHAAHASAAADRAIMDAVRMIGGALIMILVIALVLTEVYGAINISSSSPFYEIVTALESTGVSAMVLLVVGLLVIAASQLMAYFDFGGGGR